MNRYSRRRFLTIAAAATAIPSMSTAVTARWRGIALGAAASMRIEGLDQAGAPHLFAEVETELARLENIFSLYRPTSEISRLNRDGYLDLPSADLLDVLSLSRSIHVATDGAFDPTVQPLWQALAQGAGQAELRRAKAHVSFGHVKFDPERVAFSRPGGAITLNGIAQGAITDRIAALLRARGLKNVLIDMGEIAAIGPRQDGAAWRTGIADHTGKVLHEIRLADRAVATSSAQGTMITGTHGHIVNPKTAAPGTPLTVSVSASGAAVADGLSTALCLIPEEDSQRLVSRFPGAHLELRQA